MIAVVSQVGGVDDDDRTLVATLADLGAESVIVGWDDPAVDWRFFDKIVLRSCWNYYRLPGEFGLWLDHIEACDVVAINPIPLVRWNLDKGYLLELANRVAVVPTLRVGMDEQRSLSAIARDNGWERLVVKPTISASSFGTFLVDDPLSEAAQHRLEGLLANGSALVQPYLPEIENGEVSLCYLGGAFSHAIEKRPQHGEFRVQAKFGGSVELIDADPELVAIGLKALEALPERSTLARVDVVATKESPMIMELELIEPRLFFDRSRAAAVRAAAAIMEVA